MSRLPVQCESFRRQSGFFNKQSKKEIEMKKWIQASSLALMLAVAPLSFAQTPSAASLDLARQMVELQRGPEQDALLVDLANGLSTRLSVKWAERIVQGVPQEKRAQITDKLDAELDIFYNDVLKILRAESPKVESDYLVMQYAQQFTESELKELVALFNSPAFKKYQELSPKLAEGYVSRLVENSRIAIQDRQGALDAKASTIVNSAK